MDLKELRYFRAIAEFGTFSKAAAHLRVAQPALSRQLQKLERELGVELLRRSSKGVTTTPAGDALLRRTIQLEEDIERARREASGFATGLRGSLRIAAQYPLTRIAIPDIVSSIRAEFPNVFVHVFDAYSATIIDALLDGSYDAAIVDTLTHTHVDVTAIPLWSDTIWLVGPPDAAKTEPFTKPQITLTDIEHLPFIMPGPKNSLRRLVDQAFMRRHCRLAPVIESDGLVMTFAMVKNGFGFTLFPRCAFVDMEATGEVIAREISPPIRRTSCIVVRTEMLNERPVSHFVKAARKVIGDVAKSGVIGEMALYPES